MTNNWEARERNVKRIALIASVIFHLCAIAVITQAAGEGGLSNFIEHVFGGHQDTAADQAKV